MTRITWSQTHRVSTLRHGEIRTQLWVSLISFPLPGIAVDKTGLIYFVDGTVIRRIDHSGVITTVLGSNDLASARHLSCDAVMDVQQVKDSIVPQGRIKSDTLQIILMVMFMKMRRLFSTAGQCRCSNRASHGELERVYSCSQKFTYRDMNVV